MYRLETVDKWVQRLHRLSLNQLRALLVLAKSRNGLAEATEAEKILKIRGKALGGVFSSLSRQVVAGELLVEPWGRSAGGRGLRWRLNPKTIDQKKLREVIEEVLG